MCFIAGRLTKWFGSIGARKLRDIKGWQKNDVIRDMIKGFTVPKVDKKAFVSYFGKVWDRMEFYLPKKKRKKSKIKPFKCAVCRYVIAELPESGYPQRYFYCAVHHTNGKPRYLCMFCGNIDAANANVPSYVSIHI